MANGKPSGKLIRIIDIMVTKKKRHIDNKFSTAGFAKCFTKTNNGPFSIFADRFSIIMVAIMTKRKSSVKYLYDSYLFNMFHAKEGFRQSDIVSAYYMEKTYFKDFLGREQKAIVLPGYQRELVAYKNTVDYLQLKLTFSRNLI